VVAWQLLVGAVPLLGLSVWLERGTRTEWTPTFIALLAFLATLGTAAATWTWYWLVQREDVGRLGVFMFAVPLLGLVLAWALFDEPTTLLTIAGALLTIGAVLRVARPKPQPRSDGSRG
jgi:drug/metabolite transporter (DMT)-like permease